ncbi:alpha/beta hydrolase [Arthrobacter sp. 260]|uniref:alpha/beta fold hydrolase n=1 Tax=Arthrobacter sp. 260 TaxID=2735314 RepID=UPI001492EBC7|nr:alpha/beta hydrolase [Arthrobacter sp. 260]NOJ60347.1 alpha/beta hydrolase [Arthrobacter sp. 260]
MTPERLVFVHGSGTFGAAAWPTQHALASTYDCLFLRRHGFEVGADPLPTDFAADQRIVIEALGEGGHLVAHSQGAIAAMMAAVDRPDLVRSLVLVEPACLSLTTDLPATVAHRALVGELYDRRESLSDEDFLQEFVRLVFSTDARPPSTTEDRRAARRLRLQSPPWEAPLDIVPGVPTLIVTGGWEPLYEEIADYLAVTGARHVVSPGGHRPQDTPDGDALIREFVALHAASGD